MPAASGGSIRRWERRALDAASGRVDALMERRSAGRDKADATLEEMWRASEHRHREKMRRENAALWFGYFSNLADSLRRSADEFDRRAAGLLEDDERTGGAPTETGANGSTVAHAHDEGRTA